MKELIKKNKIIIGMVHFPPLPGTRILMMIKIYQKL